MIKNNIKNIKALIKNATSKDVKNIISRQVNVEYFSYYTPSNANWSYRIGITKIDGDLYEVVTVFGAIVGARRLYLFNNEGVN